MTARSDRELFARGAATLLASWEAYTRGSEGASLRRLGGVSAAVFPSHPERAVYNNALLDRGLGGADRRAALDAMRSAYDAAGVGRYAAWVHESDGRMRAELAGRGYSVAESTRAMAMSLERILPADPGVDLGRVGWDEYVEYLRIAGAPAGLLSGADPGAFHVLGARSARELVATAIAFDHRGDCGVFNMSTVETARRRGLGTALITRHLHDALGRGCSTATLQSTPIAERLYAAAGFRDLGRFVEYEPVTLPSDPA